MSTSQTPPDHNPALPNRPETKLPTSSSSQSLSSSASVSSANFDSASSQISSQTSAGISGALCPQCRTDIKSSDRVCRKCGRNLYEPCLNCQSLNPFWLRQCRACNVDLPALKQQLLSTLNNQKQQILKYRENYGHDKTLPILKYMSTLTHPDFVQFREWAKSMTALIQKERKDIRSYVENVRAQANAAMTAQKYDKVQQILEQVPQQLLDDDFRKQYNEAGEILTEVDSLVREIRNAISTKQYSQLLACVQRYLELKANDPEAKNLQQKIEKLTTVITKNGSKLRRIPTGRFYMGSHDSDEFLRNNEHPQHRVLITKNLFVGVYPVTQKDFIELMEFNPSTASDNELCPVDSVSWYSAIEFCNKMSEAESLPPYYDLTKIKRRTNGAIETADVTILDGEGFRLMSEAEWEYVCRAGSITPWCFGDQVTDVGDHAWYFDNSSSETHPVGEKKPNAWGIFDMHGNVMEWCYDWYGEFYYQTCQDEIENPQGPPDGTSKVLRGGAWQFGAEATRNAYRNSSSPDAISSVIGFRICRNAPDENIING
ncbi:MAG: SUMF1/EgtB/PvdO family nonheme iron enzyme [Planctomycetaceae bacterium]|jgi:formylglycine-generating enzyme required for sulfatase activity|nr:SUMF1/EgtB/PvdO family nonheme iron enzyme [Planctomycetaceae bacterium]